MGADFMFLITPVKSASPQWKFRGRSLVYKFLLAVLRKNQSEWMLILFS
jgi:hypothetical protein